MADWITPKSEAGIGDAVREAAAAGTGLRLSGGGTRAGIGQAIDAPGRLSLAGHAGIELYEPGSLTVVVKSGTPLKTVTDALDAEGQMLAFEPMDHRGLFGTNGEPTVGGMVAANVSGPRRVRAGACRDFLLGVRFVDGTGRVLKNGGRVMKNVTGLDLSKLMCGAHGTLGVLTEVSLKVLPKPETARTLAFEGLNPGAAVDLFCAALRTPYEVSGAAFVGDTAYLRIEGFEIQVAHRAARLSDLFKDRDISGVEGVAHERLWADIRDVRHFADPGTALWRLSVKPTDAAAIAGDVADRLGSSVSLDWGGGLVWCAIGEGQHDQAEIVRAAVARRGGHATLVRGSADRRRGEAVFQPQADAVAALSGRLKATFDPHDVLNPGLMGY